MQIIHSKTLLDKDDLKVIDYCPNVEFRNNPNIQFEEVIFEENEEQKTVVTYSSKQVIGVKL